MSLAANRIPLRRDMLYDSWCRGPSHWRRPCGDAPSPGATRRPLPASGRAVRGKYWDSQQTLGTFELLALVECRDSEVFSHTFERVHLAPLAGRGRIAMTMRSIVVAIRVRGRLRMGGASDSSVVGAPDHRGRVAFSGSPHPEPARCTRGLRAPRASFARLVPASGAR